MARRRYISTTISVDTRVARLSDSAALLWTWMIPHAEDDATITGDVDELRWTVVPSRASLDVAGAVAQMEDLGLLVMREGTIYFDTEAFYRYQSNIPVDKRADHSALFAEEQQTSAKNSREQQTSAENAAMPLPLPSPSPSPSTPLADKSADRRTWVREFEERWWPASGRYGSKADACELYCHWRSKGASADDLLSAIRNDRADCASHDRSPRHGSTFLAKKPNRWEEWVHRGQHASPGRIPASQPDPVCPQHGTDLTADEAGELCCPICGWRPQ